MLTRILQRDSFVLPEPYKLHWTHYIQIHGTAFQKVLLRRTSLETVEYVHKGARYGYPSWVLYWWNLEENRHIPRNHNHLMENQAMIQQTRCDDCRLRLTYQNSHLRFQDIALWS